MRIFMSRDYLESQVARLTKKRYNKFQWWRRYEYRSLLPEKYPLKQRILHGDFDPSDYLYQMEHEHYLMGDKLPTCKNIEEQFDVRSLFCERMRRLNEDYQKDEDKIIASLLSAFRKAFNFPKERTMKIMENFDGTLEQLYDHVKDLYEGEKRKK